ncbi:MAG: polysaccharide pyruvyl transferase family protein [Eubacteriales bacterium]
MRIGILTHYQVESHGALLQHYALTEYLRQIGHEVYTLTYPKSLDFANQHDQKKFAVGVRSVPFYLKEYLLKRGPQYVWTMARKHFLLQKFNRDNFVFLPYADCNMDYAVVGSDEVWSIQLGANMMMYGHGVDANKLISYAPSFGQTTPEDISAHHCTSLVSGGLKMFRNISVRDIASRDIVHQFTGMDVPLVCDPVLLYGFDRELSHYHKMTNRKYVVVYGYNSNMNEPERIDAIRKYAKSIGAKVFSVGAFHKWCDKQVICDPIEMLYWFKGAEAVFTDTFHGTIAAFLGHTPMAVYVRSTNNVKLDHLLSVLGLESRKVTDNRDIETILADPLDFEKLRHMLEPYRDESAVWLMQALGDEK